MRQSGKAFIEALQSPFSCEMLIAASNDVNTPLCITTLLNSIGSDSIGTLMTSLACGVAAEISQTVEQYYTTAPGVAGVIAEHTLLTPSQITSIQTVLNQTYGNCVVHQSTSWTLAGPLIGSTSSSLPVITTSRPGAESTSDLASPSTSGVSSPHVTHVSAGVIAASVIVPLAIFFGVLLLCRRCRRAKVRQERQSVKGFHGSWYGQLEGDEGDSHVKVRSLGPYSVKVTDTTLQEEEREGLFTLADCAPEDAGAIESVILNL